MVSAIIFLLIGFYILIKGADFLIDGSVKLATKWGVSKMIIGITIIGFGTSSPELITSLVASLKGDSGIALGNIVGSNIFNIAFILGLSAVFNNLAIKNTAVKRDIPFIVFNSLTALVLIGDQFLGENSNYLSRGDSIILLLFFVIFMYYTIHEALTDRSIQKMEEKKEEIMEEGGIFPKIKNPILAVLIGLIGVVGGGYFVVEAAIKIASSLGISSTFIGLTVVAIGTSLPELVTSVMAARKNEIDVSVGNIVGSNIFNLLFILGLCGTIAPFAIKSTDFIDAVLMTAVSLLLFGFSTFKKKICRVDGIIFLASYLIIWGYFLYREL